MLAAPSPSSLSTLLDPSPPTATISPPSLRSRRSNSIPTASRCCPPPVLPISSAIPLKRREEETGGGIRCTMASKSALNPRGGVSVYLYIPNIVGYIRVLMNIVAFALCFSHKKLFAILYFFSFVFDGIDGWLARKFNQVSTFGAVLDMVTDRVSTACLLATLSQIYRPGLIFLSLLALDISSHWFQMYSTFLSGKASHKDVKDSTNWLFRAYYGHRYFMAFCCVGSEVLYIILFLCANKHPESVINVSVDVIRQGSLLGLLFASAAFGWAIKQIVNVIQMKTAADACVFYDMQKRRQ